MTCVLSAFNFSLLLPIQVSIRPTHTANRCTAVDASAFGTLRYTWVSSAYVCADSPHSATTSNNSAVYNRKSSGPSTEPCGTPHTRYPIDDKRPPKLTRWVRCTRNDLTNSNGFCSCALPDEADGDNIGRPAGRDSAEPSRAVLPRSMKSLGSPR